MTSASSTEKPPAWRSLLFVPGNQERMLAGAWKRGADAIVVDLEDSVPEPSRNAARDGFAAALGRMPSARCDLLVRINNTEARREEDLRAAVSSGSVGIVVPKTEDGESLTRLCEALRAIEGECDRPAGGLVLLPQVETPRGLFHLREIAAVPSVAAISLGDEDLSHALGCASDSPTLDTFKHLLVAAAAEAACQPLGLGVSITQFGDLDRFRTGAMRAKSWGMTGAYCIHPAQVAILNEVFSPTDDEVAQAQRVVELYDTAMASGRGVAADNGAMIDWPVVLRARRVLELAQAVHERAAGGADRKSL